MIIESQVIDALDEGGRVTLTLPPSDSLTSRRPSIKLEFFLSYTMVTRAPIKFAKAVPMPYIPEDNERALKWCETEMPGLVQGWKEGVGSEGGYRTQKLRIGQGFDGVIEGLNIMMRGEYGAEKLVYNI